jgi:DNA helicase-2/ATP-dependent DNA helicase PcrA
VGDDDQSIYGWRGAEVTNILRFERDFEGAETVRLEQNYRSTSNILAAASGVIAQNKGRLGKTLWSEGEAGEKVFVRGLWDGQKEATYIAEEIEAQQRRNKTNLRQMAILVRAGFQMREFEEKLMGSGIAYRVFGGPRFYERAEIRDALAYLRLVVQSADDLAFERIINLPKRGIGEQTLVQLRSHARLKNTSLFEATRDLCDTEDLKPKMRATLAALLQDFVRWAGLLDNTPHPELAGMVLDQSGYMAMWQADKSPEAQGRIENLKELVSGMAEFESLPQFLEYVALVMENNEKGSTSNDYVSLMTLHGAKGLEFDVVFLPGWEEGLFPSQRSMDESGVKGLEEERRLAYVGLTRARKVAYVTYAANRLVYGKYVSALPSRFVDELPEEVIDSEGEQGLYAPQADYAPRYSSAAAPAFGGRNGGGYTSAPKKQSDFGRGQRVVHGSFGCGTVVSVEGNKLDILFDDGEMRRLMDSFVEPSSN